MLDKMREFEVLSETFRSIGRTGLTKNRPQTTSSRVKAPDGGMARRRLPSQFADALAVISDDVRHHITGRKRLRRVSRPLPLVTAPTLRALAPMLLIEIAKPFTQTG
jgi:hypothetical protein